MAIEFVKVRRRDDHTVTTEIARTSLRLWPGWEPIPDVENTGAVSEPSPVAGTASVPTGPADDASEPKTKRRAAATDDKEK